MVILFPWKVQPRNVSQLDQVPVQPYTATNSRPYDYGALIGAHACSYKYSTMAASCTRSPCAIGKNVPTYSQRRWQRRAHAVTGQRRLDARTITAQVHETRTIRVPPALDTPGQRVDGQISCTVPTAIIAAPQALAAASTVLHICSICRCDLDAAVVSQEHT